MTAQVTTLPRTQVPGVTLVDVTPEVATRWLEANTHNRRLSPDLVSQYARDMATGHWTFTGDPIKFAHDGTVLDGQHRLHAVVRAEKTVRLLVVNDLAVEAQKDMDKGRKRQVADTLRLDGVKNSNLVAAAARVAMLVEMDRQPTTRTSKGTSFSHNEVLDFIEAHPGLHDAAAAAMHYQPKIDLRPAVIACAWWYCSRVSSVATEEFFESIATLATTGKGDPRAALIQRLASARRNSEQLSAHTQLSMVLRVWNAWRKGQQMGRVQVENRSGEPFPVPVAR